MSFVPTDRLASAALRSSKILGVHLAIVVDNKDGNGNPGYRVKVKLPWLSEQETTYWARIAVPMGGHDRGTYVLPEIDDQVLVVFEHGNISRPIVIGGLWSKKQEPVEVNQSGKNNSKLIKSRAGHRIIFDDKEGAERIMIVDKTKGNKIVLDAVNKIVKIESNGDIAVIAKANVIIHANALKIGTSEGVAGKGRSLLTHSAKSFSLKASSSITIGGGNTTINTSNTAAASVSGVGSGELGAAGGETAKDSIEERKGAGGGGGGGGASGSTDSRGHGNSGSGAGSSHREGAGGGIRGFVAATVLAAAPVAPLKNPATPPKTPVTKPVSKPQPKLVKLSVVENATQTNVTGDRNWAAVRSNSNHVIIEATTTPNNNSDEWKQIQWSGDRSELVPGQENRRKLSLAVSKKCHIVAALGGTSDHVHVWILWASVKILTSGKRPKNAAPFDPGSRDNTDNLGAVTYLSLTDSLIDEATSQFVKNMGTSGKVAPVATLSPKGIHDVIKSGWAFERRVWTRDWFDGHPAKTTGVQGDRDTSKLPYLRLMPDAEDKIYDLDGPDIRWGERSYETYNNFEQWIEWNGKKCSDSADWHWRAQWKLDKDPNKQITLKDVGTGKIELPKNPQFGPR
jgi:hypothetical protein